ncbi:MAG: endolytic transglycosylase MltG [Candidatus Binatia bacterium]
MKRRILLFLAALVVAGSAAAVTAISVIKEETERLVVLPARVVVEIQPGQSLRRVAAQLREAGLIGSERIFLFVAARSGTDRSIKHGRHEFEGSVSMAGILEELARAPKPILRVTIPEGLTLRDIGALLEAAGAVPAEAYLAVACSEELRRLVGAPEGLACAEGYLFPDTYDLLPGISAGNVVDVQVRRFREVVDPLLATLAASPDSPAAKVGGDNPLPRLLTLASIVEKETGLASERPRIAAVFYNRLRIGMPLQTDPTVIYGEIDSGRPWDGNLTRAHLKTDTPYNTYRMKGLPPGPICNPGRASLDAVLRPRGGSELYFVSRGDGSHEFTTNLDDHNRAVRRFQLR